MCFPLVLALLPAVAALRVCDEGSEPPAESATLRLWLLAAPANRQVVLTAVQQEGNLLRFAAPELQDDVGIVSVAVTSDGSAVQYASERLRRDPGLVRLAVQHAERPSLATVMAAAVGPVSVTAAAFAAVATFPYGDGDWIESVGRPFWAQLQGQPCAKAEDALHPVPSGLAGLPPHTDGVAAPGPAHAWLFRYRSRWCDENGEETAETDPISLQAIPPGRGVCLDGHCHDAAALRRWVASHPTLPLSRAAFEAEDLREVLERDGPLPEWWSEPEPESPSPAGPSEGGVNAEEGEETDARLRFERAYDAAVQWALAHGADIPTPMQVMQIITGAWD